jgi:hypothetical protein
MDFNPSYQPTCLKKVAFFLKKIKTKKFGTEKKQIFKEKKYTLMREKKNRRLIKL